MRTRDQYRMNDISYPDKMSVRSLSPKDLMYSMSRQ